MGSILKPCRFITLHSRKIIHPPFVPRFLRSSAMKHLIAIAAIAISANSFAQNCTQVGNTVMCDNGVSYNRIGNTTFGSDGSTATDIGNTRFYDDGSTSTKIGNTRFYDNGETSTQIGGTRFNSDGTTCTRIGNMVNCF